MGFKKVYKSLQEVFPRIDVRALRAVAIEHSKDADAAVEAVLTEIIPFFSERSSPSTPLSRRTSVGESSGVSTGSASNSQSPDGASANQPGYNMTVEHQQLLHADNGNYKPVYDTYDCLPNGECNAVDRGVNTLQMEPSEVLQTNEAFFFGKFSDSGIKIAPGSTLCQTLDTNHDLNAGTSQDSNLSHEMVECGDLETELSTVANRENELEKSYADGDTYSDGNASLTVDDQKMDPFDSSVQLQALPEIHTTDVKELDASLSNNVGSQMEVESSTVCSEDLNLNDSMSHASQNNTIEVLEQVIADARNNKTTLFSSIESVINLMKDVELKERAAEQATVEAAMGGNDILVKVEELKQMIHHAKEANSMHAGEVYGEKSILASELRELQSRVLSLSDERDESLDVLDEMRNALEVRLAEAENEIRYAKQHRVEKENAALETLAAEELIMEKVVQESKILQQQAEENAKLQEFLVDRGRLVDMLQGEIAVICQDVRLLKEKFDDNIPFSKSLSSCHTSCILASSVSSLNGPRLNEVEPVPNGPPDSPKTNLDVCFDDPSCEERMAEGDGKELEEEGWELFDGNETFG